MKEKWTERLPLIILIMGCLIYLVAKWQDLSLPFFWDELGVYGPGILFMVDHGPGLLPSALEPELSRGHPLFFYFIYSAYTKIIGFSLVKIHLFSMVIFFALVGVSYRVGKDILGKWGGMFCGALLLVSPNIFAASSMVLPEVLVALFTLLSLLAAYKRKWMHYMIWGALLMMTKESGIVVPCAVFGFVILFEKEQKIKKIAISLFPILVFILFLGIQRIQNGWYLFPYHTSLISFDLDTLWRKTLMLWEALFLEQGRGFWTFILVIGGMISIRKKLNDWQKLSLIFGFGYLVFFLINFFMDRYLTLLFPLIAIWLGLSIKEISQLFSQKTRLPIQISLAVLILTIPFFFFTRAEFNFDQDINLRKLVSLQVEATHFIEDQVSDGEKVFTNFPLYNGLLDARFGYRKGDHEVIPVLKMTDSLNFVSVFNPGTVPPHNTDSMEVIFEKEDGYVNVRIWERK